MQRIFHAPEGVRDIYNGECSQKRKVQEKIHRVFHQYGYEDIETPTFEYFEVFSREVGTIPSKELYKFFDREGNTLVLRPDFTPSVSRACATYFSPDKEPVSLCYTGNTFINNTSYRGHLKETTQMGVERIGDESADADAELLAMTVECLLAAEFDAPLFGIWSPAKKHAPFVCIEPWYGRSDREDFDHILENREWGNELEPGDIFEKDYKILVK